MLIRPLEQIVPIANCANASDPTTRNVPTPPPLPTPSTNSASNTEASKSSLSVSLEKKKNGQVPCLTVKTTPLYSLLAYQT